jgi:hypothetical protein
VFYHLSAYGPPGRGFYLLTYLSIYLSIFFEKEFFCVAQAGLELTNPSAIKGEDYTCLA